MSITLGTLCNTLSIKLQQDECFILYDVKALFTSVPIVPAINTIKDKLTKDKDLQQRAFMAIHYIICLLEFCHKNTYIVFQGRYYEQLEDATMGSPTSPIVANSYVTCSLTNGRKSILVSILCFCMHSYGYKMSKIM